MVVPESGWVGIRPGILAICLDGLDTELSASIALTPLLVKSSTAAAWPDLFAAGRSTP